MRTLPAEFDSWTPREQAAVVWNAMHRRRTKLESVLGRQLPDDLRLHNVPLVWIGEKTEASNHVFDRSDPELNAVLFGRRLSEWLEKQRPTDGRDLLLQIRATLREADELIVALRRSGQLQDHAEELRRVARLESWTANDLTMAGKSVLYGPQISPGSQPRPLWQCEAHARMLASLATSMMDLIIESRVVELEANRQNDGTETPPDDDKVSSATAPDTHEEDPPSDPIEDLLKHQSLRLYRCIKGSRFNKIQFDELKTLEDTWRNESPSDTAIIKGLKRLNDVLNGIPNSPLHLVISTKDRTTWLDK